MQMSRKEIGDLIKTLREGKTASCPECGSGKIIPKRKNDSFFKCDHCGFIVRLNRAENFKISS